ncbi:hypothetical protein JOD97_000441 [Duganella sp. 1411]|jgi:hypothetical protein|uniref:hypothetical protein n=1 Tax=Duganella sp. 1411 TaxID=2806572 RepID=UPI001AE897D1|nr:hypothetical protein [Duganella sp. 1411]MBP1202427.1 hypothetical protein [Duganella sp. 1411]
MPHDISYDAYTRREADNPWTQAKAKPRQRTDPCADDCTPRCPACGGLKCLCRPRFFPGQLLTDVDLNRLEQYVVDKNRLHNRYLHGWGVACGLEVVCDPCNAGHVLVRGGYALAPCGDDIVVCADQSVDICKLISQCAPVREPLCDTPYDVPPEDCSGRARRWVLAICYDERPVRGITAQLGMGDTACGPRCGCGGSGGCGCGANGGANGGGSCACGGSAQAGTCGCGAAAKATSGRTKPGNPQCEPTQICEGYRFVAYPAPKPLAMPDIGQREDPAGNSSSANLLWAWMYANRARFGPLLERVLCCLTRAMQLRGEIREGKRLDNVAALGVYTDYAGALREFAADFALHRCAFVGRVSTQYEDAKAWVRGLGDVGELTQAQQAELGQRVHALELSWLDIVSECFCSALLPACPQPAPDNCVPLAVVTVGGTTCRVGEICNWEARKLLITWRTVMYWFSWLPWGLLRQWIAKLCCGDERDRGTYNMLMLMFGAAFLGLKGGAQTAAPGFDSAMRAAGAPAAAAGEPQGDPLQAALAAPDMLAFMLRDFDTLRAQGAASGTHPAWAALVARMADASALAPLAGGGDRSGVTELDRKVEALNRTAAAQQQQIAAQQKQIEELIRRTQGDNPPAAPARKRK